VLLPAILGLLYAAAWGLLRHRPGLEGMVPADAFVTWWYRDLAAYDAARTGPAPVDGAPLAAPSLVLGAEVNLPSLAGIDRRRPVVEVWLDPTRRVDPRFWVLPVEDAGRVRATFRDPDLPERHARHVVTHGDWAAAAWDLAAARGAGRGFGLLPPTASVVDDSGERPVLWAVAADWPRLVDYALQPHVAANEPYRSVLAALGFDPSSMVRSETEEGPLYEVKAGRIPLVRDAWRRVTLRALGEPAALGDAAARPTAVEMILLPSEGSELARALAGVDRAASAVPAPVLEAGGEFEWEARLAPGTAREVLVRALGYAGLVWPAAAARDDFAALRPRSAGWLVVGAVASPGVLPAWTYVLAGPRDAIPDVGAFGLPDAPVGGRTALPEGVAVVTMPIGGRAPASEVARAAARDGLEVVSFGLGAQAVAQRAAQALVPGLRPVRLPKGFAPLAEVEVRSALAGRLLGSGAAPGGLFAALGGAGRLHVLVATDGTSLLLRATR
jgi:hypothetical protein